MADDGIARSEQIRQRRAVSAFRPTGKQIGAVLCAALPFAVFVGSTNRVVVNGQVVRDDSFNFAGLVLAAIALGLVASGIRGLSSRSLRGPPALHGAIFVGAGVLAVYQLLKSIGLL